LSTNAIAKPLRGTAVGRKASRQDNLRQESLSASQRKGTTRKMQTYCKAKREISLPGTGGLTAEIAEDAEVIRIEDNLIPSPAASACSAVNFWALERVRDDQ
jgi:hypothetical protein